MYIYASKDVLHFANRLNITDKKIVDFAKEITYYLESGQRNSSKFKQLKNIKRDGALYSFKDLGLSNNDYRLLVYHDPNINRAVMWKTVNHIKLNKYIEAFSPQKIPKYLFDQHESLVKTHKAIEPKPSNHDTPSAYVLIQMKGDLIKLRYEIFFVSSSEQAKALYHIKPENKAILIKGSAGTGKTITLLKKAYHLLENPNYDLYERVIYTSCSTKLTNLCEIYFKDAVQDFNEKNKVSFVNFRTDFLKDYEDVLKTATNIISELLKKARFKDIRAAWHNPHEVAEKLYSLFAGKIVPEKNTLIAELPEEEKRKELLCCLKDSGFHPEIVTENKEKFVDDLIELYRQYTIKHNELKIKIKDLPKLLHEFIKPFLSNDFENSKETSTLLLIDEIQDFKQTEIRALLNKFRPKTVVYCGDEHQKILGNFFHFSEAKSLLFTKEIELIHSFRNSPKIKKLANVVLEAIGNNIIPISDENILDEEGSVVLTESNLENFSRCFEESLEKHKESPILIGFLDENDMARFKESPYNSYFSNIKIELFKDLKGREFPNVIIYGIEKNPYASSKEYFNALYTIITRARYNLLLIAENMNIFEALLEKKKIKEAFLNEIGNMETPMATRSFFENLSDLESEFEKLEFNTDQIEELLKIYISKRDQKYLEECLKLVRENKAEKLFVAYLKKYGFEEEAIVFALANQIYTPGISQTLRKHNALQLSEFVMKMYEKQSNFTNSQVV